MSPGELGEVKAANRQRATMICPVDDRANCRNREQEYERTDQNRNGVDLFAEDTAGKATDSVW